MVGAEEGGLRGNHRCSDRHYDAGSGSHFGSLLIHIHKSLVQDRGDVEFFLAKDAQCIGNYTLATILSNKTQKSMAVALSQATYNPVNNTVTLVTRSALVLNPPLKLTINAAGLPDSLGRPLDGNHDGQPGGNCVVTLSKSGASIA